MKQNSENLQEILESVGLHTNESLVYLTLLKLGQVGAGAIINESNLHGQMVYRALDRLIDKNYVEKTLINGRSRFTALSPKRILEDTETKTNKLAGAIELLEQQNVPAVKDQIQVFQGKDQFVNHELDNIRKIEKNSEILACLLYTSPSPRDV